MHRLALAFLGVVVLGAAIRAPKDHPNVIMLFVDDLGYGDLGFTGHPSTSTPNIDNLAANGMTLTSWYSGAPLCSASRGALMTGRTSQRIGVLPVFGAGETHGMQTNETTVGQLMKAAGYKTGIVGKWHLGERPMFMPGSRGFDEYLGIPYSDDMGEARASPCNGEGPVNRVSKKFTLDDDIGLTEETKAAMREAMDPATEYLPLVYQQGNGSAASLQVLEQPLDFTFLAEKYNNFTLQFIEANAHQPFFLYMPFSHVHTTAGNQPNKQYAGCTFRNSSIRGPFGDALSEVDWIIGNVMAKVKDLGLEENTLVLFTGDNGPWLAQGASGGSEGLFIGRSAGYWNTGKGCTYEGGIREAGFAYWPGTVKPSRSAEVVSSFDLFPTLANLTNQPLPTDRVYDGKNMLPVLMGHKSQHEFLWVLNDRTLPKLEGPAVVRYGKYKAHFMTQPGIGECQGNCTAIVYGDDPPLLFNVEEDPSEAYPLTKYKTMPTDPVLQQVVADIAAARAKYMETLTYVSPETDPTAKSGTAGICCDRTKHCDCDGPPSSYTTLAVME